MKSTLPGVVPTAFRLAISGQLGDDALASEAMQDTMKLCVSCKACKLECPTGVDMARMKIEVTAARFKRHGPTLNDRLVCQPARHRALDVAAARRSPICRVALPALARSAGARDRVQRRPRRFPTWRRDAYRHVDAGPVEGRPVILFADTFNTWFEPENLARGPPGTRRRRLPGHLTRTVVRQSPRLLWSDLADHRQYRKGEDWKSGERRTRGEMRWIEGAAIVGLEPSCTLGLREELPSPWQ